jgi:hypothetical protein
MQYQIREFIKKTYVLYTYPQPSSLRRFTEHYRVLKPVYSLFGLAYEGRGQNSWDYRGSSVSVTHTTLASVKRM